MKKLSTIKVHNLSKSTTLIIGVSPSKVVRKNSILKFEKLDLLFVDKINSNYNKCNYKVE